MAEMTVSNSIVVNAPIDQVFETFNDPTLNVAWGTGDREVRGYTPPLNLGTTYDIVTQFMGREINVSQEVIVFEPPNHFHFRVDGVVDGESQHDFEVVEDGVRVTINFSGEMKGFLGALAAPLLKSQINKRMQEDLKSFKAYIEK